MPLSIFMVGIVSVIGAAATVLVTSRSAGLNHLPAGASASQGLPQSADRAGSASEGAARERWKAPRPPAAARARGELGKSRINAGY
jgi:hypothetical protein